MKKYNKTRLTKLAFSRIFVYNGTLLKGVSYGQTEEFGQAFVFPKPTADPSARTKIYEP
jgi:hypothetical protein